KPELAAPMKSVVATKAEAPRTSKPNPAAPSKKPVFEDDEPVEPFVEPSLAEGLEEENDGKTVPAYDIESYERERAARAAASGKSPPVDDDRTTAGVSPPPVEPAPKAAKPARGRAKDDSDARAAELLAKVDAMALEDDIATKTGTPAHR